jgi:hypothetical protein
VASEPVHRGLPGDGLTPAGVLINALFGKTYRRKAPGLLGRWPGRCAPGESPEFAHEPRERGLGGGGPSPRQSVRGGTGRYLAPFSPRPYHRARQLSTSYPESVAPSAVDKPSNTPLPPKAGCRVPFQRLPRRPPSPDSLPYELRPASSMVDTDAATAARLMTDAIPTPPGITAELPRTT